MPSAATMHTNRRHVTLELIRKRAEHNEGLVSNLEELALHQEELEAIGPILGRTCGKTLRILLLQNNVIDSMDPSELKHFKRLEYLNLAINNITVVEGMAHLEFLEKLDLTLNFIHFHTLRKSLEAMIPLRSLKNLYLIGNPCYFDNDQSLSTITDVESHQEQASRWYGYRHYVIAKLPQLQTLDGKDITRSERIKAQRNLLSLEEELDTFVAGFGSQDPYRINSHTSRLEIHTTHDEENDDDDDSRTDNLDNYIQDDQPTYHCPQDRLRISHEMAAQKAKKEKLEMVNQPQVKGEMKDLEEQFMAIEKARSRQEQGEIRQCNEGKWTFQFDEDLRPGFLSLIIPLPKYLSSSLIDVDVHPTNITVVIKSKVLRLILPVEVKSDESTAQRSTASGKLVISMPKFFTKQGVSGSNIFEITRNDGKQVDIQERNVITKKRNQTRSTLGTDMIAESLKAHGINMEEYMNEVSCRRICSTSSENDKSQIPAVKIVEDEDIPPPF